MLALLLLLCLTGCGTPQTQYDPETISWDQILADARGTTVTFYSRSGDDSRTAWLNTTVADYVMEQYGITLKVMEPENDAQALLSDRKAGADVVCISGADLTAAGEEGLLYGPFTDKLPSLAQEEAACQAPYAKNQLVMYADTAVVQTLPSSWQTFEAMCQQAPGMFTYPDMADAVGSAFVCSMIYEVCGWKQFQTMEADDDIVRAAVEPAMAYLRSLNPYLWKGGEMFPDAGTIEAMYEKGELALGMSCSPFAAADLDSETTDSFVFAKGTIASTDYMVIPEGSSNKAGAMAVINAILSVELQLSCCAELRELPALDTTRLSAEERAAFDAVELGEGVLSRNELTAHSLPDMPADLIPVIEAIWRSEVVGK